MSFNTHNIPSKWKSVQGRVTLIHPAGKTVGMLDNLSLVDNAKFHMEYLDHYYREISRYVNPDWVQHIYTDKYERALYIKTNFSTLYVCIFDNR